MCVVCGKPIVKHPSHLLGFPILQEPGHFGIQLSELAEGGADVSVKVLVLLILVIEYSFVLLPFLHTADLWVLSVRRGSLMTAGGEIKYIYIYQRRESFKPEDFFLLCIDVNSHDIVCNDAHFGSVFRCSVRSLVDLRSECVLGDVVFAQRLIHFISE